MSLTIFPDLMESINSAKFGILGLVAKTQDLPYKIKISKIGSTIRTTNGWTLYNRILEPGLPHSPFSKRYFLLLSTTI